MSQPSIPDINPVITVTKKETVALLLSSIAMSELAISHVLNAEAEKMQSFVHYANHSHSISLQDYLKFNRSVSHLLQDVNMELWLSLGKMDRITEIMEEHYDEPCAFADGECEE